ncbi:MAG: hypothetical protein E7004_07005 [Alphaproteobacteria bacterium]|nr:hypothetical protein [Alphaproteobacteria bacterium]
MSNKKRIFNLVTSIVTCLAAIAAIICFINEPMSLLKALGIYFASCFSLAVVEFLIIGFSHYYEKIDAMYAFTIGFGLNFIVASIVFLSYVDPLWLAIIGVFIVFILMLLCYLSAFVLGTIYACKRI